MSRKSMVKILVTLIVVCGGLGSAVAQMPNPYGPAITLENAKKAAAPALAEAAKNHWTVAGALVGPAGPPVYFLKMGKKPPRGVEGAAFKGRPPGPVKRAPKRASATAAPPGAGDRCLTLTT